MQSGNCYTTAKLENAIEQGNLFLNVKNAFFLVIKESIQIALFLKANYLVCAL